MGIFTVPTASVRKTRIYVSPSSTYPGKQLTVYKTEVDTMFEDGFMILPIPYPETLRIHSPGHPHPPNTFPYLHFLDRVEFAFDDRERRYPRIIDPNEVTSYQRFDVIDSIDELREWNERESILPGTVMNQLAEIYHQPYWGCLLCALRQGSFVYEPICYTHRMISDELFLPSLIYQPRRMNDLTIPQETDRYDDRYFMNGCYYSEHMRYHLSEVNTSRISSIPWEILPQNYREYLEYFLSESRRGHRWNGDAMYRINEPLNGNYRSRQRHLSNELYSSRLS
jgi:hypothetical protein